MGRGRLLGFDVADAWELPCTFLDKGVRNKASRKGNGVPADFHKSMQIVFAETTREAKANMIYVHGAIVITFSANLRSIPVESVAVEFKNSPTIPTWTLKTISHSFQHWWPEPYSVSISAEHLELLYGRSFGRPVLPQGGADHHIQTSINSYSTQSADHCSRPANRSSTAPSISITPILR